MTAKPDLTLLQLEAIEYARQAMNLLHRKVCLECDECRCGHYDAVLARMTVPVLSVLDEDESTDSRTSAGR